MKETVKSVSIEVFALAISFVVCAYVATDLFVIDRIEANTANERLPNMDPRIAFVIVGFNGVVAFVALGLVEALRCFVYEGKILGFVESVALGCMASIYVLVSLFVPEYSSLTSLIFIFFFSIGVFYALRAIIGYLRHNKSLKEVDALKRAP